MGNCINSSNNSIQKRNKKETYNVSYTRKKLHTIQKQGEKELKQNYIVGSGIKVLGSGAFGQVFKTCNKYDNNHQVAIKVLHKSKLKGHIDAIQQEVDILTKLDHPNIVKYYETYNDDKYMYLVMEYIGGGELFEKIAQQTNQVFSEDIAAFYMKKLFSALNHMHSQGVVHRDIKPENIMLTTQGELKLIDFGLAQRCKFQSNQTDIAGTPYYMAPEVLDGHFNEKCDIWSIGVLLYVFMSGYLPFQGQNRKEVFHKISNGIYHFNHKEFQDCSKLVINLIKELLVVDPKKRLSSYEAMHHPWFKLFDDEKAHKKSKSQNLQLFQRLKNFKGRSKLKKAAMNMLVKMSDLKDIQDLMNQFKEIDKDQTGLINVDELKQAMQECNIEISKDQLQNIIDEVDYFGNKKINYTEFLMATLDVKEILDSDKLVAIFNQFDTDGSGYITRENIVAAMNKIGRDINQQELDEIMNCHDIEQNGIISFLEFKALFLDISDIKDVKDFKLQSGQRKFENKIKNQNL